MYKIYCTILNNRSSKWAESNNILSDDQNGFRKGRSTTDHVSFLTNIVETRKKQKLSTFCTFIDFRKAYDFIGRSLLWNKLDSMGIHGNMLQTIQSLYNLVSSCVRINSLTTEWFDVKCGFRQGCSLSPLLFNLFIDDLVVKIKAIGEGIDIDNDKVCILLYADDIVLVAETENDLQLMLNVLSNWCTSNAIIVNHDKSNIIHFRSQSASRSSFVFTCGDHSLKTVGQYTYLGLLLDEFLDYNKTAKCIAQSAGRAQGLLIAKSKALGSMPYDVFVKLYDSMVWPVISYGASIWGNRSFSCIDAIQNRAMRFYLGVGRYTPTAALYGELAWQPTHVKQWRSVCQQWHRFVRMDINRVNYKIFSTCLRKSSNRCKNWQFIFNNYMEKLNLVEYARGCVTVSSKSFCEKVVQKCMSLYKDE